mmetsp:Transcript_65396/g.77415  ORF Transcript_65396/g.77415 Transcript_65396/m.77415 type:complete len:80 (-) Transcript_65396:31-270(-)
MIMPSREIGVPMKFVHVVGHWWLLTFELLNWEHEDLNFEGILFQELLVIKVVEGINKLMSNASTRGAQSGHSTTIRACD